MMELNASICATCHTNLRHPILSIEKGQDSYWCERFLMPTADLLSRKRSAVEHRVRHRHGER